MITLLKALFVCLPAFLFALSPAVFAQVYKYIDENGNIAYSDTPPADKQDMQPTDLPNIIVQPSVEVPDRQRSEAKIDRDIQISISSPAEGATILGGASSFSVSASVNKKLLANETVRLMVNGTPHASSTARALNWQVTDLIRGEYQLSAEVLDTNQKVIASSPSVQIFVQRNIAR